MGYGNEGRYEARSEGMAGMRNKHRLATRPRSRKRVRKGAQRNLSRTIAKGAIVE